MIGIFEAHYLPDTANALLREARSIVRVIPERVQMPSGRDWIRCHEVARIVGELLDLAWVDGKFGAVDHSWCVVPQKIATVYGRPLLLDVYAVGRSPAVQLVDLSPLLPYAALYRAGTEQRMDIHETVVSKIVRDIRGTACKHGVYNLCRDCAVERMKSGRPRFASSPAPAPPARVLERDPPEFFRASGESICSCGKHYRQHPHATEAECLGGDGKPFLRRLCDGALVKL